MITFLRWFLLVALWRVSQRRKGNGKRGPEDEENLPSEFLYETTNKRAPKFDFKKHFCLENIECNWFGSADPVL